MKGDNHPLLWEKKHMGSYGCNRCRIHLGFCLLLNKGATSPANIDASANRHLLRPAIENPFSHSLSLSPIQDFSPKVWISCSRHLKLSEGISEKRHDHRIRAQMLGDPHKVQETNPSGLRKWMTLDPHSGFGHWQLVYHPGSSNTARTSWN